MTLLVAATAGLVAATLFAYVGYRLGKRVVSSPEGRAAFTCFRIWWYGAAAATAVAPVRQILYMNGRLEPWMYETSANVTVVLASIALWGLLCNLVYLYTGSVRWWGPIAGVYVAAGVLLLGVRAWMGPALFVTDNGWELVAATSRSLPQWGAVTVILALLAPPLAASLAYLGLLRFAPEPTQRYRIVMVSGSLMAWFGGTILAGIVTLPPAVQTLFTRSLGILAALIILLAYDPPRWLRDRLGVARAGEELLAQSTAGPSGQA